MPERIRLTGLVANALLAGAFALFGIVLLFEGRMAIALFFLAIALTAGFNWYVIRKAAQVLAEESWKVAQLEQRLAGVEQRGQSPPRSSIEGPPA